MPKWKLERACALISGAMLVQFTGQAAPAQSIAKDTNVVARELADDLTSLGDYEVIDGKLHFSRVLDSFVDCTSIKLLVVADESGKKMVYDVPTQNTVIRWTDTPFDAAKDTSNFTFFCVTGDSCVRITSPGRQITWSGEDVVRAPQAHFRANAYQYNKAALHFKVLNKLCRAQ